MFSPDKFIFLDRDGVINRDSANYIKNWDDFEFLPGSLEALKRLTAAGYRIIVITNQSIINRKWVLPETLEDIFKRMQARIEQHDGKIHDIFFCPHRPDEGCGCRKPAPGLIQTAARVHNIDVSATAMVGDSAKDILCARNAGCRTSVLVQSGSYQAAQDLLQKENVSPDAVARDLLDAVEWILNYRE